MLNGTPLRTILTGQSGVVSENGESVHVDLPADNPLGGAGHRARLFLPTTTGRIECIETFSPERPNRVLWRVTTLGSLTSSGNIQMPTRVIASRYTGNRASEVIEYTLRSTKFNDTLPPHFISATPILAYPAKITDYRQSAKGTTYLAEGDLLPVAEARWIRFRELTRYCAPIAILVQIPLIAGILLWRRIKAEASRS